MAKSQPKPGPDPDRLQIDGDWKDAVGKALGKKKPPEGWPDHADDPEAKERAQESPEAKD